MTLAGIVARRRVPPPGGLSTSRRPASAPTRSARPRRPEPFAGSAPPAPSSRISTTSSAPASRAAAHAGPAAPGGPPRVAAARVLRGVGKPPGGDEVGGRLDGGGEPLGRGRLELGG